jgi:hypothetical protein
MLPHLQELLKRIVPSECTHRDNDAYYSNQEHAALLDELKQKHAEHVFSYVDSEGCTLNLDQLISSHVNASPSSGTVEANCSQ